jgi:ketosteroid isomerase-like protein
MKGIFLGVLIVTFVAFAFGQVRTTNQKQIGAKEETGMATRDVIQSYFDRLKQKKEWESFFAEDVDFYQFTSPNKHTKGKAAYIEATKRFYSSILSAEVRDLIIEGEKACALTRYELQPPKGNPFNSDVAEIFTVRDGKIVSYAIYFDTAPFTR